MFDNNKCLTGTIHFYPQKTHPIPKTHQEWGGVRLDAPNLQIHPVIDLED